MEFLTTRCLKKYALLIKVL